MTQALTQDNFHQLIPAPSYAHEIAFSIGYFAMS